MYGTLEKISCQTATHSFDPRMETTFLVYIFHGEHETIDETAKTLLRLKTVTKKLLFTQELTFET